MGYQYSTAGAHLCCGGRPNIRTPHDLQMMMQDAHEGPSCRICRSCGGKFHNDGGKLMKNQEWPYWIRAYDTWCTGTPSPRTNPGNGFSMCCSELPLCTFCISCGGEW